MHFIIHPLAFFLHFLYRISDRFFFFFRNRSSFFFSHSQQCELPTGRRGVSRHVSRRPNSETLEGYFPFFKNKRLFRA